MQTSVNSSISKHENKGREGVEIKGVLDGLQVCKHLYLTKNKCTWIGDLFFILNSIIKQLCKFRKVMSFSGPELHVQ